jgi:acyl-[acyl-carrier-protein]-phospholipid O-acyltransferase/long-chain-fatty-acid--[acyl-carrier-protein] ligase
MERSNYLTLMRRKGFGAFLGTQFMGALNDNLLKWVIIFLAGAGMSLGASPIESTNLRDISLAFIVPSLIFTGLAGFLADNFNKRRVLILTKAFEIGTMGLAWFALRSGQFHLQLGVLFLLASQFTFFGPAKYGILPELVDDADLSRANGLLESSTFLAIILGSIVAGPLFQRFRGEIDTMALIMLGLAILGSLMSLGIAAVPEPAQRKPFKLSLLWSEVIDGTRELRADRRLWLTNLGVAYFWFQGTLFQLAVVVMGREILHLDESHISFLQVWLALGIGAGSMLAGRWSGDKVELGLVPLGSLGMGVASMLLAWSSHSHPALVGLSLGMVGASAGLFAVPLMALLQQKAEAGSKGRIQAASNFFSTVGIIVSAVTLDALSKHFSADKLVIFAGIGCFVMTAYLVTLLPEFLVRFALWLITHTVYRIRIEGALNVPRTGPALIVCNHMSLADGLLVQACIQRFVRFMVYKPIYDAPALNWIFRAGHTIPISSKRADSLAAIEKAKAELQAGHVVCIFAEGGITRTGNLLKFKRGLEHIMEGVNVPIIPVHLDGLWGSIFSFRGGKFIAKMPEKVPYPVTVTFGEALPGDSSADSVRQKVQELSAEALEKRLSGNGRLEARFIDSAKRHYFNLAIADSTGAELSYGKALAASLTLSRWMQKNVKEPLVGVLLPASAAGSLANLAAAFADKTTVNLNFTAGADFMAQAIEQCELKTVLSSRAFLEKTGLAAPAGTVYVEDLFDASFKARSLAWFVGAMVLPRRLLKALVTPKHGCPSDLATIIFSSGSTGTPKGVMLTHKNIQANLESIAQVLQVYPQDRLLGALPFFHSLGYTGTIWFPLCCGFAVLHHPNPMDAGIIGRLAQKHRASILFSTPTFCQVYVRKITPEQFFKLRFAMVGAEKLRAPLADAFKERFHLDLLEGYGATEMAPLVAINVPDVNEGGEHHVGHKPGTVGAPVPGVAAKVVDVETGVELPIGESGLLLLKGPNRMAGYWKRPDLTEAALRDGWYVTGDVASIDRDGFIQLTDRLSRFSKIGGEMVPHLRIEDALRPSLAEDAACVVSSVPDEAKGERLVLLHTDAGLDAAKAWADLSATELPKLWVPRKDAIFHVESIPSLGSGKTDLRKARELATTLMSAQKGA